ncbi:glycosyltransferase [Olivibacter sp. SDN3]|uniref:glycosyltransferase n=1 Tax=Olivibacter sp. SDN3 TaxID=2764720 RepID=UPI0016515E56|nr:glycosyltransferase [Olivibacter sp. SDN3]QNL51418.1 glycosyltransferase [Olivibacter sp. SDN3]
MDVFKLCIIKPNKSSYSETFIQTQIDLLQGEKHVLYGGDFPLYKPDGTFLIRRRLGILIYLFQKRLLRKKDIPVRNDALISYLKTNRIAVVLAEYGTVGAMVAKACRAAQVPLVIHFHGVDAHRYRLLDEFKPFYKEAFTYAAAIIAVSGDMRDNLIKLGADPGKVHLIPYGVNTDLFQQVRPSANLHFLSVGRLVEKKAPLTTIAAFDQVVTRFPNAQLRMVGDGPLLKPAKALVKQLGIQENVIFTGVLQRQAILALMSDTYCYVQHSVTAADGDMEGTPNTILEASAVGLPIISTKHAGIKEAVTEGVTGFLVDEYDEQGMADRMIAIASSREMAEKLGEAARQHMLKHYHISEQIAKLQSILQQATQR